MKRIFKIAALSLLAMGVLSCNKNKVELIPGENFDEHRSSAYYQEFDAGMGNKSVAGTINISQLDDKTDDEGFPILELALRLETIHYQGDTLEIREPINLPAGYSIAVNNDNGKYALKGLPDISSIAQASRLCYIATGVFMRIKNLGESRFAKPVIRLSLPSIYQIQLPLMHNLEQIQKLVGNISLEQMQYVDAFVHKGLGVFMPVAGPCYFAQSPNHSHPGYMFVLSFDDNVSVKMGTRLIPSQPGKLFALSPNIQHQEITDSEIPKYIALLIDKEVFEKEAEQYEIDSLHFDGNTLDPNPDLLHLLKRFMNEMENQISGYRRISDALSIEITHSILRSAAELSAQKDHFSSRLEINKVIEYINLNLHEQISLADMANQACMSSSHFSRIFKHETGYSPIEYLIAIRLQRAKNLLRDSSKAISDIAADCGFSSPSYLSSSFQKKYNISPVEFQRKLTIA